MKSGELRKNIISECPEEFKTTLINWLDNLESLIGEALSDFDIRDISQISNIEDGVDKIQDIKDALY